MCTYYFAKLNKNIWNTNRFNIFYIDTFSELDAILIDYCCFIFQEKEKMQKDENFLAKYS